VTRQLVLFLIALQFLTRLPTPGVQVFQPNWVTRASRYFPLAGQLVGALCAATYWAADHIWQGWAPALLAIGVGILVTGAFHEDGLADTADGLGGGLDRTQRLAIMKDSRVGTYGVLALILTLAVKASALATLTPGLAAAGLIGAHGAARGATVVAMRLLTYGGDAKASKWQPSPEGVRWREVALALGISAWPLLLLSPAAAGASLGLGALLAMTVGLLARRLVGGHTGDVLGAIEQVFEMGFLLGLAAIVGNTT
jgi:adenosylcobinamide-GDP ribazoletransferase